MYHSASAISLYKKTFSLDFNVFNIQIHGSLHNCGEISSNLLTMLFSLDDNITGLGLGLGFFLTAFTLEEKGMLYVVDSSVFQLINTLVL